MDKNFIKLSIFRNSNYTVKIEDNYLIPAFLIDENGKRISTISLREFSNPLKENYLREVRKDIKELKSAFQDCYKDLFRYIVKFPIIIEDKDLWNKLLDFELVDKFNPIRNVKFLLLDIFFSKLGISIDICVNSNDLLINKVKDKYIKIKYGIDTIRYNNYGESIILKNIDLKYLEDYIRNFIKLNNHYNNTQLNIIPEDTIIQNYLLDYQGALNFINNLELYLSDLFYNYDKIILTKKDIYNIDPDDFDIYTNIYLETQYINSISTVLKEIFGKELYVHNTMKFSLKNIMWGMKLMEEGTFSWDIFIGKEVSPWITTLFGYPPREYINKFNLVTDRDDGGLKKFLNELKKLYKFKK